MIYHILTIFPNIFNSYFNEGIIRRAREKDIIRINPIDIRAYTNDKHKTVDDKPYGGGAGMIMKIEPLYKALSAIKGPGKKIILLSPQGEKFNQRTAKKLSKEKEIIFICGRYEGIDARIGKFIDEEISIGDYVLTGGELGAMVIIDAVTRLLPEVLGNKNSLMEESHSAEGLIEYPQYTRPEIFEAEGKKLKVPKILLSGHHKKIEEWKKKKTKRKK